MSHDDTTIDTAALFALGALEGLAEDEVESFRRSMAESAALRREVESLTAVASELVHAAPEAEPPAELRSRVLARAGNKGPAVLRAAAADWQSSGVEGVDVRQLLSDAVTDRQTILVRMQAGSVFPTHGHHGPEECYVIEGDLVDGDTVMLAGDYVCHPAGSTHGPLRTEKGCVLLVVNSLRD